ncbi:MFS transporter [Neobacillus sp. PS3-40]|uniref:MDR family MFS transporter n=1 Tax=Neobacillus sp. PS3-40 TaxID=3070679 RepID=UPI0027E11200|nr:MFS transporter [Neobacillus sp. PS3-40]WML44885.1 MFS transporter [Neobacillus sp. PS3-40]
MTTLKKLHPLILNIIIGTMFGRMATSMSIPFLAIYLTNVKGVSSSETGMIIAVSSFIGIGTSFFGGYLSDRFGRKIVLYISIFLWVGVFIGFGVVNSVAGFFVVNAMNGFCRSVFEPTSRALLADLTEPKNRLVIFNLRYTAINIGVIFGPIVGYYLGSSKTTFPFFIAAAVYIIYGISLIITFRKYPLSPGSKNNNEERVTLKQAFQIARTDSILLWSLIGLIFAITGYSQFGSTLPQYLSNTTQIENGAKFFSIFLALNAAVVILIQYPLLKIGKKYSPILSIILGNVICSTGLIGFGLADTIPIWIVMVIIFTFGEVLMFSMTDMFMDTIAKPNLRGTYFGAMGFTQIGNVLGPALGGFLLDYFGYNNPLMVFGSLFLLSIIGVPILINVKLKLKNSPHMSKLKE